MDLICKPELASHLNNNSQRARVISEAWFAGAGYCLNCSSNRLVPTRANTVARDCACPRCGQPYELKSSARVHTSIVQDGSYTAMMERVREGEAPALMLMHYSPQWHVQRLVAIHPVFLTPAVVVKRAKPHTRPGTGTPYQMCDLNLSFIPDDGKISVVKDGKARPHAEARRKFRESARFSEVPLAMRGWAALVLAAVRRIGKMEITNADLYAQEGIMHSAYPGNSHISDKIRQQMQVLERLGYVERIARGEYRVMRSSAVAPEAA